jgi:hypothetical protein
LAHHRPLLILLLLTTAVFAQEPTLAGVALNDTKPMVRSALTSVATFQREEEGQQIWEFHSGPVKTLIVGFNAEGKARYITTLGTDVPCEPLGNSPQTIGKPPDLTFQRTLNDILVIAHGSSLAHLNACSLKDPKAKMLDED